MSVLERTKRKEGRNKKERKEGRKRMEGRKKEKREKEKGRKKVAFGGQFLSFTQSTLCIYLC